MRRAARVDANQKAIVEALRDAGRSVLILSSVGKGCPDILVGWGRTHAVLMEIKDGQKPPSERTLTKDQQMFHAMWRGPVVVVTSVREALDATAALQFGLEWFPR